jgi:hypothetical protein
MYSGDEGWGFAIRYTEAEFPHPCRRPVESNIAIGRNGRREFTSGQFRQAIHRQEAALFLCSLWAG